jgi:hypothetical protein
MWRENESKLPVHILQGWNIGSRQQFNILSLKLKLYGVECNTDRNSRYSRIISTIQCFASLLEIERIAFAPCSLKS